VLIEKALVKKMEATGEIRAEDFPGNRLPVLTLLLAELHGKIALQNMDIIWSCTAAASTFELVSGTAKIEPCITGRGTRSSRYSEKLCAWVKGEWEIEVKDNFSDSYRSSVQEESHKTELIRLVVNKFFSSVAR